jgi:hypothetical protein
MAAAGSRILLYGLSLSFALIIALFTVFIKYYPYIFVPILVCITSVGFNALSNYISCNKLQFKTALRNSVIPAITVLVMFAILTVAPGIKAPVTAIIPNALPTTQAVVGNTFYIFWAAIYGQTISGGLSQICS